MNYTLWNIYADDYYYYNYEEGNYIPVVKDGKEESYANAVEFLSYFVDARIDWLSAVTGEWNGDSYSIPLDPVVDNTEPEPDTEEPVKQLSFFERIAAFFRSIIDWFANLFK